MPRRPLTEEEKQAKRDILAKAREAKKEKQTTPEQPQEYLETPVSPPKIDPDYNDLRRQIEELRSLLGTQQQPLSQPQFNQTGRLIGTVEKYIIDPKYYPDPRERLLNEPRLQRFAFKENYELNFDVSLSQYESKDGMNIKEPKFTIELIRIIYDDDGEKTNRRYVVCNAIFHEDPQAAITIAREQGIPVDESNQRLFLDEMRYLRMRDWLLEAFYPPQTQQKTTRKDMVIDGKLVQYYEINSENSEVIPFGQLTTKL